MNPERTREKHDRLAGIELDVDDTSDPVVLNRTGHFAPARFEDVYGCLKYDGRPFTVAAMDEAVQRGTRTPR
jgi:hypothetical protein